MAAIRSPRIELTGHQSDIGCWQAQWRSADPRLRDYVRGYFASEGYLPAPLRERHMPSLVVPIVLNFAAPHRSIDPSDATRMTEHRNAWVVALQHRHQLREAVGTRDFLIIQCTPIGAQMLLRTPMELLTDRTLALDDIDGRFAGRLVGHAEGARAWADRFEVVERIIAQRLASASPPPLSVVYAWKMLQQSPEHLDLARLPQQFGCSRRHLIAQCHTYFGMPPKTIARIRRFHLAVDAIDRLRRRSRLSDPEGKPYLDFDAAGAIHSVVNAPIRWADLALECGYYDQSHFINDFRSFSGLTPLEFLRQTRQE